MKPFWVDEFERMNRIQRDLMESPAARLVREMDQHRQLIEPPGYRMLLDLQEKAIGDYRSLTESMTAGFSSVVQQFDRLKFLMTAQYPNHLVANLQRSIRTFQPSIPVMESLAAGLLEASRNSDALRQFEQTFGGQFLELAREIAEAPDEDVDERVENLTELLGGHIAESNRGPISIEGWAQILLAIMLYLHSVMSATRSEERVMKRLDEIETQLKAMAVVEKVERLPELRVVSANVLRIRVAASAESDIVGKLTRNSLVRIVGEHKTWAKVEYFDFVDGETKEGWVSKQHLQELPDDLDEWDRQIEQDAASGKLEKLFAKARVDHAAGKSTKL